ncbi:MAG: hypothetical protein FWG61_01195 [Firmicutes bacterium]|nr:hypothetical protein [Bacillota bacterium]
MKKYSKQLLALVICTLVLLALLPTMAYAAEGDVCEINGVGYSTLNEALEIVQDKDTIKLLANIDHDYIFINGISVTFDLDGQYTLNVGGLSATYALVVADHGEVKLLNEIIGKAELNVTASYAVYTYSDSGYVALSNATCNNGNGVGVLALGGHVKVSGNVTSLVSGYEGVYATEGAVVEVGGNVGIAGSFTYGIFVEDGANVKIYGSVAGLFYGIYSAGSANKTLEVLGDVRGGIYGVWVRDASSMITIQGILIGSESGYIRIQDIVLMQFEHEIISTKTGYLEYTDGVNFIWVKSIDPCAGGHDFSVLLEHVNATCEVDGYEIHKCSRCAETVLTTISAIGHDWNSGYVIIEPTPWSEGIMEFTCNNCQETYTVILPKLSVNSISADAFVEKLNGNKNNLIISVTELVNNEESYGQTAVTYTALFSINNNAAGIYQVGPYNVYVNTKGNTQIREIYIVDFPC